jgi:hypothetical protein
MSPKGSLITRELLLEKRVQDQFAIESILGESDSKRVWTRKFESLE